MVYLRLCLTQSLEVPLTREIIKHPTDVTPIIRKYLQGLYNEKEKIEKNALLQYVSLIKNLLIANPGSNCTTEQMHEKKYLRLIPAIEPLSCMLEVVGCVPTLHTVFSDHLTWLRDLLNSTKEEVREQAAVLYAVVISRALDDRGFEGAIDYLISQTGTKSLEAQHGAILGIGNCMERKIIAKRAACENIRDWHLHKIGFSAVAPFLSHQNALLIGAACVSIGLIGKSAPLPLDNGKISDGSPDAKRPANANLSKLELVRQLLDVMNNAKLNSRIRERAAKALGLICVGEMFPHTREVIRGLIDTAKETKDVEVHFTIGESLVMCLQSVWSPEARDAWQTPPNDFTPSDAMQEAPSCENLEWLLQQLFGFAKQPHPNVRQATCIWLLAILKGCADKEPVKRTLPQIQNAFMDFLGENNGRQS